MPTTYVPSATTLVELRLRPTAVPEPSLLALADPVSAGDHDQQRSGAQLQALRDLGSLPHARAEVRQITRLFGTGQSTVLFGQAATEQQLKAEPLEHSIVHLATHGWIDASAPASSGLVLAQSEAEDGLLQLREILRLPLSADLVTLSACQSALGDLVTGEGMIGMARAFFYAGTDSVVATLWNVDDRASALFMEHFYRNLRGGASKAEALRRARLELRHDRRYRHAYFWAAYVLIGSGSDGVEFPPAPWWRQATPIVLLVTGLLALGIWLRRIRHEHR